MRTPRRLAGFTLIELVTAIAVAVVALALAAPGFTRLIVSHRLTQTSNALVSAINLARLQAVRGNQQTIFCSNSATANTNDKLGTACAAEAGAVYAMEGTQVGGDPVRAAPTLPDNIRLGDGTQGDSAVAALRYGGAGLAHAAGSTAPYTGLVADVYTQRLSSDNHRCIYLSTGSVVSTCTLSEACPGDAPATCR